MRQAALVVPLLDRACRNTKPQRHRASRLGSTHDRVTHAIGQNAISDARIMPEITDLMRPERIVRLLRYRPNNRIKPLGNARRQDEGENTQDPRTQNA